MLGQVAKLLRGIEGRTSSDWSTMGATMYFGLPIASQNWCPSSLAWFACGCGSSWSRVGGESYSTVEGSGTSAAASERAAAVILGLGGLR